MARRAKQGLNYFPFDVDFMSDIKVRRIIKACGAKSVAVLVFLYCNIYADNGYYIVWDDEDMPFLISDEIGISEGAVLEVLKKAVQIGLFDEQLFSQYKILTSKGIQRRFLEASMRRKEIYCDPAILLISTDEFENVMYTDDELNRQNVCRSTAESEKCIHEYSSADKMYTDDELNRQNVCRSEQSKKEIESKKKEKRNINSCSQEANDLFERLWAMYPRKRGKNQVSPKKKLEILKVGEEEMIRAIERYKREIKDVEEQYILNGSTFFQGRYKDYAGDNYVPTKMRTEKGMQVNGKSYQDILDEWEKS